MKEITCQSREHIEEAVAKFLNARHCVALTGAGISVESGIDDFRSPGGLWSKFPPDEYGTISVFHRQPEKSWKLFRALGRGLVGKKPNQAHDILAQLEEMKRLKGIVTQNIDNLHQDAGNSVVLEIHGNHHYLQCLGCGDVCKPPVDVLEEEKLPLCSHCDRVLKPNVVLFGENVRQLDEIHNLLHRCDLLMVIGTSAQVYPAAALPEQVKYSGGLIYEFNIEETVLTHGERSGGVGSDYFFHGSAAAMLELFLDGMTRKD